MSKATFVPAVTREEVRVVDVEPTKVVVELSLDEVAHILALLGKTLGQNPNHEIYYSLKDAVEGVDIGYRRVETRDPGGEWVKARTLRVVKESD